MQTGNPAHGLPAGFVIKNSCGRSGNASISEHREPEEPPEERDTEGAVSVARPQRGACLTR